MIIFADKRGKSSKFRDIGNTNYDTRWSGYHHRSTCCRHAALIQERAI